MFGFTVVIRLVRSAVKYNIVVQDVEIWLMLVHGLPDLNINMEVTFIISSVRIADISLWNKL